MMLDSIMTRQVGESQGFESSENALLLLWADGREQLAQADKATLARRLVEHIALRLQARAKAQSAP